MVWKNPDGSEQLAYPRGPAGTQTFMAYVGPDGKLQRIENVLNTANFARIQAGMSKDQVLRILGPSGSQWTQFYSRSNQLAWSWLFCNSWNVQEFFDVMFDGTQRHRAFHRAAPEPGGARRCSAGLRALTATMNGTGGRSSVLARGESLITTGTSHPTTGHGAGRQRYSRRPQSPSGRRRRSGD
jgi:hypothetical protein